ncbi:MAG: hypothetical protein ACYSUQ_11620, partial [Planctomycetota bacterium]
RGVVLEHGLQFSVLLRHAWNLLRDWIPRRPRGAVIRLYVATRSLFAGFCVADPKKTTPKLVRGIR